MDESKLHIHLYTYRYQSVFPYQATRAPKKLTHEVRLQHRRICLKKLLSAIHALRLHAQKLGRSHPGTPRAGAPMHTNCQQHRVVENKQNRRFSKTRSSTFGMWHAASCVALSRGTALCTIPHQLNWALTVELGLLERLDLADVDVLHRVDALDGLEDLPGDVLGDAGKARSAPSRHTSENNIFPTPRHGRCSAGGERRDHERAYFRRKTR